LIRFDRNSAGTQRSTETRAIDGKDPTPKPLIAGQPSAGQPNPTTRRSVPALAVLTANGFGSGFTPIRAVNPATPLVPWLLSNGTGFETTELPYIHYFMTQFPNDRWASKLSHPIATYLVMKATDQPVLRHATVAVAALLASHDPQKLYTHDADFRYLEHKQKALHLVRQRVMNVDIDGYLAVAIAFLLMTEIGDPGARIHMNGLKSVLQHIERDHKVSNTTSHDLPVSPMYWISWAAAIRLDVDRATIQGDPVLEPLSLTADCESVHQAWISEICHATTGSEGVQWGVAVCTLRILLHRAFYIASKARLSRMSSQHTIADEATIQQLCTELDSDMTLWLSRPIIHCLQVQMNDIDGFAANTTDRSLENAAYHYMMNEYRTTKLYLAFIADLDVTPAPPGSERFDHALRLCRSYDIANTSEVGERCNQIFYNSKVFQLVLCYLTFGEQGCPPESEETLALLREYLPPGTDLSRAQVMYMWKKYGGGLPSLLEFSVYRSGRHG